VQPQINQPQVIAPQVQPQTMVNPQVGPMPQAQYVNAPPSEMPKEEQKKKHAHHHHDDVVIVIDNEPDIIYCPRCERDQRPIATFIPGAQTWCWFCFLLIFFFPLAWLPFCCPACMDPVYVCPLDGTILKRVSVI